MRINPFVYGVLVLSVFLGVIFGLRSFGVWSISGKVDAQGERIAPSGGDVDTIKGWMTIGEIAAAYDLSLDEILALFQLPADTPAETAIKDLESETFSVSTLREWLQARIIDGVKPQPLLTEQPASATQTSPTDIPIVATTAASTAQSETSQGASSTAGGNDYSSIDRRVTGKTTFQNLLDWGMTVDAIRQVIGSELPAPETLVKDYITSQGEEFSSIRSALQAEVDKLKP